MFTLSLGMGATLVALAALCLAVRLLEALERTREWGARIVRQAGLEREGSEKQMAGERRQWAQERQALIDHIRSMNAQEAATASATRGQGAGWVPFEMPVDGEDSEAVDPVLNELLLAQQERDRLMRQRAADSES